MKVNFEEILFNKNFEIANKTFFISGNEETLINKVEKTTDKIGVGIQNMIQGAKDDYIKMSTMGGKELTGYSKEQVDNWDKKTKISQGKKYIKIVQDTGVFCFIVKEDFKHFKKGDILKAAGYNAPALNSARGNVLTGNYPIQWTGPLYMDSQRRLR